MIARPDGIPSDAVTSDNDPDEKLPDLNEFPELKIYSHSTLVYWWPVWFVGYVFAAVTYFSGGAIELDEVRREWFHPSSAMGITYVALLLLVIVFTNLKMRGIYSALFIVTLAFITVLFAWLGWWDEIAGFIPHLSVHMNMGFYIVFSTALLVVWLLTFFIFDRLVYWRVRPGQMTEEHLVGGAEQSYDSRGMLFEQRGDDLFRHTILGLGAGDLVLTTSGAKKDTIYIPNVLFAAAKIKRIQKLIAVKPDSIVEA